MSIKIENLSYTYAQGSAYEIHALKNLSLEIHDGEFIGIIGHTGSGKSTLIQLLDGLIKADEGHIYYDGEDIYAPGYSLRSLRGRVGLVFQYPEYQLFETTVLKDAAYGPQNQGFSEEEALEKAREALVRVKLPEKYWEMSPFELSGGMNQRVGICISMLQNPSLLLADEPTSALDVTIQKQVVEEMLLMREEYGTAMIVVTHNIGVVEKMADKVLVLKNGKVREYGKTAQVLTAPEDPYTKELMSSVPRLKRTGTGNGGR